MEVCSGRFLGMVSMAAGGGGGSDGTAGEAVAGLLARQ